MSHRPITEVEKINRLPWLAAGDTLTTMFALLTFSGPVYLLYLNALGLEKGQIGFLLSLVPFAGIVAPFIAPWVAAYGYKRVYVTFWGLRKVAMAAMLLTPLIISRFGPELTFLWVAGVIATFALCRAIAETGGFPWKKEAVPDSIRGKFTAINNISATVAGIIVTIVASFVIDVGTGLNRFMLLIAAGIGLGFFSLYSYSRVPGGAPVTKKASDPSHLAGMWQAVRDRDFVFFLTALGLATVGGPAIIAFIPLFMKEEVGLSEGNVVLLSIGTYAGAIATSYWWGWAADRYGSKPIMQSSLYLMLGLPLAWFLIPRHSPASMPLAVAIAVLAGMATLAWQISWMRYLFVNAIPADRKSPYTAVYYAWFGLINGLGPLLAGQILDLSRKVRSSGPFFTIDPFTPLFALSGILLVAGLLVVAKLRNTDEIPFRRFAGMFVRGNVIKAMSSLIQYNLSGDEMTRMVITERMGEAQNPLSGNELLEALHDPSFNVRYQAIQSIGRMPPTPQLVEALVALLAEGHSELSFVVTRALGRLGDPQAIEPLRQLLSSGYRLIEANSARALAMLGDVESGPAILDKLKKEPNKILAIAYASALGKLGLVEATPEIFALLRQTQAETQRSELGLALARMAGEERYYMQHWRSLSANPATATAQAILVFQKLMRSQQLGQCLTLSEPCAQRFAQGELAEGVSLLRQMIDQLPLAALDDRVAFILRECNQNLADFGPTRREFIVLALHTLDIALRQLNLQAREQAVLNLNLQNQ